jgi:hypothetical protein
MHVFDMSFDVNLVYFRQKESGNDMSFDTGTFNISLGKNNVLTSGGFIGRVPDMICICFGMGRVWVLSI